MAQAQEELTKKESRIRKLLPCHCGNNGFRKVRTETMQSIITYLECTQCKSHRDEVKISKTSIVRENSA